nr:YcxB family protein [uncultured Caproiciproducens sp.]
MELIYTSTVEDYRRFAKKRAKPKRMKATLIFTVICFVIFLIMGIMSQFPAETVVLNLFLSVLYGGILFLILNMKLSHNINKNIKKIGRSFFDSEKSIILNEDGIIIKTNIRESKMPYDAIKQLQTDTDFFVIEFKAGDMVYIPTSGIKNRNIKDDFVFLIKSKTV